MHCLPKPNSMHIGHVSNADINYYDQIKKEKKKEEEPEESNADMGFGLFD